MRKILIGIGTIGLLFIGTKMSQPEEYSASCNAEYLRTKVTNEFPLEKPFELITQDGCRIKVNMTSKAKGSYYALEWWEREEFMIKAKKQGDFYSINTVYKPEITRTYRVIINDRKLRQSGTGRKCFDDGTGQLLCFQKEKRLPKGNWEVDVTVNDNYEIKTIKTIRKL